MSRTSCSCQDSSPRGCSIIGRGRMDVRGRHGSSNIKKASKNVSCDQLWYQCASRRPDSDFSKSTYLPQSRSTAGGTTSSTFFCPGFGVLGLGVPGFGLPPPKNILPIISNNGFPALGILMPKYISPICVSASSHSPTSLTCAT